jgi:hypothetical protein
MSNYKIEKGSFAWAVKHVMEGKTVLNGPIEQPYNRSGDSCTLFPEGWDVYEIILRMKIHYTKNPKLVIDRIDNEDYIYDYRHLPLDGWRLE